MSVKIAILGANGFIGNRLVEIFHLEKLAVVRPIVRSYSSLALPARFDLDCRVADVFDPAALQQAFSGCDVVIHAIAGDRKTVCESPAISYQAAEQAGVKRLVYLSSASVHGQSPAPGTDEQSALIDRQVIAYNNWKVQAEKTLGHLRRRGSMELVILRPGIVWGPRSQWIGGFADAALNGTACLINQGKGICNSVYIDNLAAAILLAATVANGDGHTFIVGDAECITWADLYQPLCAALGISFSEIPSIISSPLSMTRGERFEAWRQLPRIRAVLNRFPKHWRQAVLMGIRASIEPANNSPWTLPVAAAPAVSREMELLYQCAYKLPHDKARKLLGYEPNVIFAEGCRRTLGWLAFAGYPVVRSSSREDINTI